MRVMRVRQLQGTNLVCLDWRSNGLKRTLILSTGVRLTRLICFTIMLIIPPERLMAPEKWIDILESRCKHDTRKCDAHTRRHCPELVAPMLPLLRPKPAQQVGSGSILHNARRDHRCLMFFFLFFFKFYSINYYL